MLAPDIGTLKRLAAHSQSWADWATLAVFVGLLGEILTTFLYTKDKSKSEITLEVVCAVIITAGVLGEWNFGARAAQANAQLVAMLDKEANDANERAAVANQSAAEANRTAEQERLERIQLEEKVAWRTFTKEQRHSVIRSMSAFAGQLADCSFLTGDMEAFSFSSEIASALRAAKWQVVPPNPNIFERKETTLPTTASPIQNIDFGVEVKSTPDRKALTAARAAAQELERLGFDASFKSTPQRPQPPQVWIVVDHRPLGPQGEANLRRTNRKRAASH